jgi:hypothetical protein
VDSFILPFFTKIVRIECISHLSNEWYILSLAYPPWFHHCNNMRYSYQSLFLNILSRLLGVFVKLRKATVSFIMSVCPHGATRLLLLDAFVWNMIFGNFSKNLSRKFRFDSNLTRITGTLPEDLCTFMISRWILLTIRNVSGKSCR